MIRWLILTFAAGYALKRSIQWDRAGVRDRGTHFRMISAELLKMR